jgi:ribonuclease PH
MTNLILRNSPRAIKFTPHINPYAAGSVIAEFGNTKVHITVTIEDDVPRFLKDKNQGWLTAEYSMLPGSTHERSKRERQGPSGRSQEIQRLIGRSLRSVMDFSALGPRTLTIDCDVLVADGGTRTTAISGAYVAVKLALDALIQKGVLKTQPLREQVGAVSVGINAEGKILCDLNYGEDSQCDTDMKIVMTRSGKFIELQGTAEKNPFGMNELKALVECAQSGLQNVFTAQDKVLV